MTVYGIIISLSVHLLQLRNVKKVLYFSVHERVGLIRMHHCTINLTVLVKIVQVIVISDLIQRNRHGAFDAASEGHRYWLVLCLRIVT